MRRSRLIFGGVLIALVSASSAVVPAAAVPKGGPPPSEVAIGDATITEGNSGKTGAVVAVTMSPASVTDTVIPFQTESGTATSPSDFQAKSGTVTIPAGRTSASITVPVNGDTAVESNEAFVVRLLPGPATIRDSSGAVSIGNDDASPTGLSVGDVAVYEGDAGTGAATFTIRLSDAAVGPVSVDYATQNVSAAAPSDYKATAGTATIGTGKTSTTVAVQVRGDVTAEPTETFRLKLTNPVGAAIVDDRGTATITDDETPVAPEAPTLSATRGPAASTITINWTVPGNGGAPITAYNIDESLNGVDYTTVDTAGAGATTDELNCGAPSATCYFHVRAYNSVGAGADSNTASATTYGVPGAPVLTAHRGPGASLITIGWTVPSTDGLPVTAYNIDESYNNVDWTTVDSAGAGTTTDELNCGTPKVTCYFRVRAYNDAGVGPDSNTASATTYNVPRAPTLTAVRGPGAGVITITWTVPTTDGLPVTAYNIDQSYNGVDYVTVDTAGAGTTTDTLSCGSPLVTCYFRVHAYNDAGGGPDSNVASATTYNRPNPPVASAQSGLPDSGQVHVSWTVPATDGLPVTGYTIDLSFNGTEWFTIDSAQSGTTGVNENCGESGTFCYYRVVAYNDAGVSDASNSAGATAG